MQVQAVGMPWFHEDDYEAFRLLLPDRSWHASHGEWEAAAQQNLQRLHHQGVRAIKAEVRSADFAAWCRRAGCDIDAQALLAYANEAAARHLASGDG